MVTSNKDNSRLIAELRQSLSWMDLVLSNIGEGILVVSTDMIVLFANDAIAEMMNKSRITLLGKPIWKVLNLFTDEKLLKKSDYEKAIKRNNSDALSGRYEFQTPKNSFSVDVTVTFIPNVDEIVFIIRDITQQLKNQKALLGERIALTKEQVERQKTEEDRQLFQDIMDGSLAIVYLKDAEGRYEFINRQFKKVFDLEDTEILGKTDTDLFSKEIAEIISRDDEKVLISKSNIKREESILIKGEKRHYLSLKYPLLSIDKKTVSICGFLTDITARKKLEEIKNDFIKMVYHELNTPLTVMKLFLQAARADIKKGKIEELSANFTKIESQLEQVTKLTDDLLEAAKMEKAELKFSKHEFNITELVKNTVESEQTKTEKHDIHLLGKPDEYYVIGDRQRIGQVMHNLLSNAIKYSPDGGDINVRVKTGEKYITVSVQDFGIGISKHQQKYVFDQFNRGSLSEGDFSGLGMGLFIAAEIITRHDGSIKVKSEEGKGSTFSFRLPL